MSTERPARHKSVPQTPADKTDAPHRVREESVSLLETSDYVCVQSSAPLAQVIEQMKNDEGSCAIICDGGRVIGLFTESDLLNKVIGEQIDMSTPISEFASTRVETLAPDATIGEAVRIMNEKGSCNIPLVKDDQIVGAISVFDVITYLAESYPKETMNLPPVPAQVMDTQEGG